ncbi:abscisic acid-insensitive 5-like protein 2 [Vitis vinifera]|uniref:Abscisic acid-insensitive 5-like protein 2 n=1 Tax=Vitis vinifera TaxID=29760 RepID=A0A438J206_VITVI|nr:abscisic acid-insensitive 5-like protein 2 [Vitis vinifera]
MGVQTMGSQGGGGGGGGGSGNGDLGKPLTSMNLDELLKNVWTVEANNSVGMDAEGAGLSNQSALQREPRKLTSALSKKAVDEVWRDIQGHGKNSEEKKSRERQPTLGEMTLEDFLVKTGVVAEPSDKKIAGTVIGVDPNVGPQFPQQGQPMPQPLPMGPSSVMDVTYPDNQVALSSPLMGALSDTQAPGRKRVSQES